MSNISELQKKVNSGANEGLSGGLRPPLVNISEDAGHSSLINRLMSELDCNKRLDKNKRRNCCQSISKGILMGSKDYKKWQYVIGCNQTPIASIVQIRRNKGGSSYFSGLNHCGSWSACPICGAKIGAQRCSELSQGVDQFLSESPDNEVLMMVLTHSHKLNNRLASLLDKGKKASSRFWSTGSVKRGLKAINCIGRVSAFETTVSQLNGWHPHQHILLFCEGHVDREELKECLSKHWFNALKKFGLSCSDEKGLTIYGGNEASRYVTKLPQEICLTHLKEGNSSHGVDHYSPLQLLMYLNELGEKARANKEKVSGEDAEWAAKRYLEYCRAMKGKTFIKWSKGLRERLGVAVVSDKEILEDSQRKEEKDEKVLSLLASDFRKLSNPNVKAEVLYLADQGEIRELRAFLKKHGVRVYDADKVSYDLEKVTRVKKVLIC